MQTRLWVTGIGLVTPLGLSADATWDRLVRGERAIGPVDLFDPAGQRTNVAAQVALPDLRTLSDAAGFSRTSYMARLATREALKQAKLTGADGLRIGLVVGGTTGGMFENERLLAELHANPPARDALAGMLTHPLTSTTDKLVAESPDFLRARTLCSACSSGANAIVVAAGWLLAGDFDVVVAGGSDGLCRLTYTGFNALGAIDPEPCRPFDHRRRGLTLGEGAGFIVLERAEHARRRGVKPISELAGWSLGAEAHHITNPEASGELVASLIEKAIASADLRRASIDYVNAHGTGTPLNDAMESTALKAVFKEGLETLAVSSSKGQIGHTLGAAGGIEAVIAALTIERQMVPPTGGLEEPDPACRLAHVMHKGRSANVRAVLSNSFGFGGMDTVLAFTEPEFAAPKGRSRTRVVITGAAVLSPVGVTKSRDAEILLDGARVSERLQNREPGDSWAAILDPARARRFDRAAKLATVAAISALDDAEKPDGSPSGIIFGSAFGSLDSSAAFMHRLFDKGPRLASPAEFPNLVPSAPAGHASIYLGLRGPAFTTGDLAVSGESAIFQAIELVERGEATRIVAGSVEERNEIVTRVLAELFARSTEVASRRHEEGSAAVVVESEQAATERGRTPLCQVEQMIDWRDESVAPLAKLMAPFDLQSSCVVLPRPNGGADALLAKTPWRDTQRRVLSEAIGEHDGLGAVAIATAAGLIGHGDYKHVLVLGLAKGRGCAVVLSRA